MDLAADGRGAPDGAVAIIGVSCRLPGGIGGLPELWTALEEERDMITTVPADRFDTARFVDISGPRTGKSYTAAGGFLDDIAGFDAAYFGIAPKEAAAMDPQHRLLLELTAEALDDAAVDPARLAGTDTAVFVGVSDGSYALMPAPREITPYTMVGGALSLAANRVSHAFDLRGPSMSVDTACSSALVALDRACRALRDGSCRTALCGGVNVLLNPQQFLGFSQASMLSARGRCAAFSADADGFVRAEGGVMVLLKPLADARADGDRVHGVILGTGTNCDGRTPGVFLPSAEAQEDLLRRVCAETGVDPDELVYFEAHGTGTPVGDPIEATAIGRALGMRRITGDLPVGSVKANLGHLEPAAGMAGLCKALLVLRHRAVPAAPHAEPLNPAIDFTGLGLRPVTARVPVAASGRAVVGVNSFGFGGANAHLLVAAPDPAPEPDPPSPGRPLPVLVSARSARALGRAATRLADRLDTCAEREFPDVAGTLWRRGRHEHRAVVLAAGAREAARGLRALAADGPAPDGPGGAVGRAAGGRVAFVYAGNGSQWPGMGSGPYAREAAFRDAVDELDAHLAPCLGWSVAEVLTRPPDSWRLEATEYAQPLLLAVQSGITAVLRAHGITPSAVPGHSVGEVAAAHAAGVLDTERAARVIAERSAVQAPTRGRGRMAAVGLSAEEAADVLARYGDTVVLAGINSPRDVTVAGPADGLAALGEHLRARGVFFQELDLDHAFHSPAMDDCEAPLARALAGLAPSPAAVPFYSTVTGTQLRGTELDAHYWWHNIRRPVRFADAAALAREDGADVFLELGPHPVLGGYLRRSTGGDRRAPAVVLPTLRRDEDGPRALSTAVAALIAAGAGAAGPAFRPGRVVDLPAYPWEHRRHWTGGPRAWLRTSGDGTLDHPLLGERMPAPHPQWHGPVEPVLVPWLRDHRLQGAVLMPATGYVEMALAAGRRTLDDGPLEAGHLLIRGGLVVPWDDPGEVGLQTSLRPDDGTVTIASTARPGDPPRVHATARVRVLTAPRPAPVDPAAVRARCPEHVATDDYYRDRAATGLEYGPAFQVLTGLSTGPAEVLAAYRHEAPGAPFVVHPAVLDGALQAGVQLLADRLDAGQVFLPASIAAVRVWDTPSATGFVWVREHCRTEEEVRWDLTLTDPDGNVTVRAEGCRLRRTAATGGTPVTVHHTVVRAAPRPGEPRTASPLPAPRRILDGLRPPEPPLRPDRERRARDAMDAFAARHHANALARLLPDARAPFAVADLLGPDAPNGHRAWALRVLGLAHRHGTAEALGDGRHRLTAEAHDTAEAAHRCLAADPAFGTALALAATADRYWTATPDAPPADLVATADQVRGALPADRRRYRLLRALFARIVELWPPDRPLRVLDTGDGTTALALLPVLPPDRVRYHLTGVPPAARAALPARLAALGHDGLVELVELVETADPPAGAPAHAYDVVVDDRPGDHPAPDAVLRQAAALLAPGGHLVTSLAHDTGLRDLLYGPGDGPGPVLRPPPDGDAWPEALRRAGFTGVARTGTDGYTVLLGAAPHAEPLTEPLPWRPPAAPPEGAFLLLADDRREDTLRDALAAALTHPGAPPVPTGRVATTPREWTGLLDAGASDVVLLLGRTAGTGPGAPAAHAARTIAALGALAAACGHRTAGREPRLWLVTHPHDALPGPGRDADPAAAALWGAARTLANEHPGLHTRRIALARTGDPAADAGRLARELLAPDGEDEVVLTAGGRFVPRERPGTAAVRVRPDGAAFRLRVRDPGLNYRLSWAETEPVRPGPGEVAVAVRAVGLNYRDVMQTTGLLPGEFTEGTPSERGPGVECAGTVTACGPGVTGFRPGDRVVGIAPSCLGTHTVTPVHWLMRLPDGLTFAEGATGTIAFVTVHYGLGHLARLRPGETLLVHGAAGGVGLAALRYASRVGARPIATAGSGVKRSVLRSLGVEDVLDSRALDFADRVRALTDGRGVDVVLNSLAGEAMVRGLELLRPGGRFVELGKRDIHENKPLPLRPFQNNTAFFAVDISALLPDRDFCARLIDEALSAELGDGEYHGLPHSVFPAARVHEAFRLLQHSRHIGKVIVTFDPEDEPVPAEPAAAPPRPDPAGTYLVTGGTGGFGAATAVWLAERGARHIALVSRRGAAAPEAAAVLAALAARGVRATAHAADVTSVKAMRNLIRRIDRTGWPLRGVVHAAAHFDDAPLTEPDEARAAAVLAPKATGAAVLDALTRDRDCDLFLCHSSGTALLGNVTQAAYAAGNLAVEALVRRRRREGRPGLAIAWGALSGTGHAARGGLLDGLAALGVEPLPPRRAFAVAERLPATADVVGVGRYRWPRVAGLLPQAAGPRLSALVPAGAADDDAREQRLEDLRRMPAGTALDHLVEDLTRLVADALGVSPDGLDPHTRLDAYGMDSLTGTQFFTTLQEMFDVRIPPMELLSGNGTIAGIARQVHMALGPAGAGDGDDPEETATARGDDGEDGHAGLAGAPAGLREAEA
ncbi:MULTISPECIES: type I polyketide synthase [Streptomyces]|uniref:type I polyketide synthase n=1 Tax=Streptomyces TaxID=1883 RepID=UPI001EE556EE|nr:MULTISPECIES: type I polyketide synthase [Streptomyces]UKW27930.1 SDR family NAD(P)-dependent oxidoreductase [Streptomyces sp. TYQ1024]